jgi:hypothetical protein
VSSRTERRIRSGGLFIRAVSTFPAHSTVGRLAYPRVNDRRGLHRGRTLFRGSVVPPSQWNAELPWALARVRACSTTRFSRSPASGSRCRGPWSGPGTTEPTTISGKGCREHIPITGACGRRDSGRREARAASHLQCSASRRTLFASRERITTAEHEVLGYDRRQSDGRSRTTRARARRVQES